MNKRKKKYGFFIISTDGSIQGVNKSPYNRNLILSPNEVYVYSVITKPTTSQVVGNLKFKSSLKKGDVVVCSRISRTSTTLPIYIDFSKFQEKSYTVRFEINNLKLLKNI